MQKQHRYQFEKGSKKHSCPNCNKKRFVRYIDNKTGEYLPEQYGRCDRAISCPQQDYNNPYKDGYAKAIWMQEKGTKTDWKPQIPKPIIKPLKQPERFYIPVEVLKQTLTGYDKNTFIQNLLKNVAYPFEVQDIEKVISLYRLGTVSNTRALCIPFIDKNNNINAVQEKIFDTHNHTDKTKKYNTSWMHSRLTYSEYRNKPLPKWLEQYNKNDGIVSCLFGEHLLSKYPYNPIALVESPKTAIYGTLYFGLPEQPKDLLWLAAGSLDWLTPEKCKTLKARNVYLFPDLSKDGSAYDKWKTTSEATQKQLQGAFFQVSDLLEQLAPQQDKEQGKDLADYLIKQDWRLFRKQQAETVNTTKILRENKNEPEPVETLTREKSEKCEALKKSFFSQSEQLIEFDNLTKHNIEPENWNNEIEELESYFTNIVLPTEPIKLNKCSIIKDCSLFIKNHFETIKTYNGKTAYLPYLLRLKLLMKFIKNSNLE